MTTALTQIFVGVGQRVKHSVSFISRTFSTTIEPSRPNWWRYTASAPRWRLDDVAPIADRRRAEPFERLRRDELSATPPPGQCLFNRRLVECIASRRALLLLHLGFGGRTDLETARADSSQPLCSFHGEFDVVSSICVRICFTRPSSRRRCRRLVDGGVSLSMVT